MAYKTSNTQDNILLFPLGKSRLLHTTQISDKGIQHLAEAIGNTLQIPLYTKTLVAWFDLKGTNQTNLDAIVLWLMSDEITKRYFDASVAFEEICGKFHRHLKETALKLEMTI